MPWLLEMTLLTAGIKLAVDAYLGWRLTRATGYIGFDSGLRKGIVAVLFFLFYLLPLSGLIHHLSGQEVDLLNYPKPVVYLFWGGLAFSFQVLFWILGLDLLKIVVNRGLGIHTPGTDRWYGITVSGVAVLVALYAGIKVYHDTHTIETEQVELKIRNLPAELEGFRVVHITDIQADRYTGEENIIRYVQKINEQNPDLIVFTGDLISYGTRYIEMAARTLAKAESAYGVQFIIGDHDYWAGTENVRQALEKYGISILEGENVTVGPSGSEIRITGITHVYSRKAPPEEVERLTRDSTAASVKVLASHQVSDLLIKNALSNNYHMILGGHTHGGQIRLPLFFRKISASEFETDYIRGQYYKESTLININSGLGFTLAPIRYNARPNITVIELMRE